jgi:hypothetical protein
VWFTVPAAGVWLWLGLTMVFVARLLGAQPLLELF